MKLLSQIHNRLSLHHRIHSRIHSHSHSHINNTPTYYLNNIHNTHHHRLFSSSNHVQSQSHPQPPPTHKELAQAYNIRRSKYKKAVTKLRHTYSLQIQKQTRQDLESKQKQQTIITRKRLERQRLKNIQSTKNAMKQEQFRLVQKQKFEEHLKDQARKRKVREDAFHQARKLVVQELEQQSEHWMTTPDEVDAILDSKQNHYIDQQLWTRPGSYVGEPNPSNDSKYWKYESHTWKIKSSYPLRREVLLNKIEDMVYDASNVDRKVYWNKDRLDYQLKMEQKAKLRALVLAEGRKSLLLKQKQLMQDLHSEQKRINEDEGIIPPVLDFPIPSTDILANYDAMEEEGVKVLKEDPTKFFVFANQHHANGATGTLISTTDEDHNNDNYNGNNNNAATTTTTTTSSNNISDLGKPIRLVDPVRDGSYTNTPYPEVIGRLPKPDLRTDREKKKQEREERMLAAAAAAAASGGDGSGKKKDEMDADLEDELSFGTLNEEDADYIKLANTPDEEDIQWEKGHDDGYGNDDDDVGNTPYDQRYTEEDIDWTIAMLEGKIASLKEIIALEDGNKDAVKLLDEFQFGSHMNKDGDGGDDDVLNAMGPGAVKSIKVDEKGREYVSYDIVGSNSDNNGDDDDQQQTSLSSSDTALNMEDSYDVDADDEEEIDDLFSALEVNELNDLIKIQDTQNVLKTLTNEQIKALQSLDDANAGAMSQTADEIRKVLSNGVPGLSDAQLDSLVELELSLAKNEDVRKKLKKN